MLSFPNCKINIGLNIVDKRADGYHNLETIFYPIGIKDALEMVEDKTANEISFTLSGEKILGNAEENICVKAYHLLKKDFPQLPNTKIHLHKAIPMGAGLGGGSADAATTLLLLNKKFNLNISTTQLLHYALALGSDCPFFIINKPCYATSRGEILEPISLDLSTYKILIVNPNIHVNTKEAFVQLNPENFSPVGQLKDAIASDITTWKHNIKNDFEIPVFAKHPSIKKIKETMYDNGAIFSSMTGSGSTVFGIFEKENELDEQFPEDYFCRWE